MEMVSILDDKVRQCALEMVTQADEAVRIAAQAAIGGPVTLLELAGRLSMQTTQPGWDTVLLDGKPLLRFGPVDMEVSDDGLKVTVSRKVEVFKRDAPPTP